jgi:hypothetical protein
MHAACPLVDNGLDDASASHTRNDVHNAACALADNGLMMRLRNISQ